MRILVVQESDWLERGPHQSHHLMERLVSRGHEVRTIDYQIDWKKHLGEGLISPRKIIKNAHKVMTPGVTVVRPSFIRMPGLCYASLLLTHRREIERQIRDFRPDVVVGFGLLNARMAIRQCRRHNIPFIYYVIDELHRLVPEEGLQAIARLVEMQNNRLATKVISINEGLRDYTVEMGANPAKTHMVKAGVDFERFSTADGSEVRRRFGFTDDDAVMFFMGWLYDFSGLDEVALEMAHNENKKLKMLILGKGELRERLQAIKEEHNLGDRLIIEDWKPYGEVPAYLAAADICLLPAKRSKIMENIVPIKMYEYLAAGKVVFATDLPGIRKEFREGNGVIYISSSREAVAKANELLEKGTIGREGSNGQAFVRPNDWALMTDQFEEVLREVSHA